MQKSIKTPDYKVLEFVINPERKGTYDLVSKNFKKFTFFVVSIPRNPQFKRQGAQYIIESWKDGKKVLFSGLKPIMKGYYYGDHKNTNTGKKSAFFLKKFNDTVKIYYFNYISFYPSKIKIFLSELIKKEEAKNLPQSIKLPVKAVQR